MHCTNWNSVLNGSLLAPDDFVTGELRKEEFGSLVLRFSCFMTSPKPAMIGAARSFEGRGDACAQPIMARLG